MKKECYDFQFGVFVNITIRMRKKEVFIQHTMTFVCTRNSILVYYLIVISMIHNIINFGPEYIKVLNQ